MRRLGWVCFLYAFSHAYFGVSAIKNVQNGWGYLSLSETVRSLLSGAAWTGMLLGSVMMMFRSNSGRWMVFSGGLVSAVSAAVSIFNVDRRGFDFLFLLMAARPPADFFMVVLLVAAARLRGDREHKPGMNNSWHWKRKTIILSGFVLPWVVWAILRIQAVPVSLPAPLIAVFMTFWYGIPFICLALLSDLLDAHSPYAAAGGFVGASLAVGSVSFMMWGERFDSFLMPVSAPLRFASMGAGITMGFLIRALLKTGLTRFSHQDR